jgi:hypothetical protein
MGRISFAFPVMQRLTFLINNDLMPRLYEEHLVGLPFTHL